jgi:SNF2 family DNA or RNA helicase
LVVAPKAVLSNWMKEAERWLPKGCVTVLYDGPGEERKALQRTHLKGASFNLLLTHYHIAISDRPALSKLQARSKATHQLLTNV